MRQANDKAPKFISKAQLAKRGLSLIQLEPLVIQCQHCGAEWRPLRLPALRWWHCHNGCNRSNPAPPTALVEQTGAALAIKGVER
jgi:hypothetical protein